MKVVKPTFILACQNRHGSSGLFTFLKTAFALDVFLMRSDEEQCIV